MIRRPSLPTALSIAVLVAAAAIAVGALQIRSDNLAPPDWAALCSPDPDASNRGTRRIVLNKRDRAGIAVRVPTTFVESSPDSISASSAIYPTDLILAFSLPQDRAAIAVNDFTVLRPAEKTDTPWLGDQLRVTITVGSHGPTPDSYMRNKTVTGIDEKSGLAKLSYDRSPYEGSESYDVFVQSDPAARTAIYWCHKGAISRCRMHLDGIDNVHASLLFDRFRLSQAPALEATTRAMLRCFLAGGKRA